MPSDVRISLCRTLHRDDDANPARFSVIGNEEPLGPPLMTGSNDRALGFVAQRLGETVEEYLKWMSTARDLPNQFDIARPGLAETVMGDADTQYFLDCFDLKVVSGLKSPCPLATYRIGHSTPTIFGTSLCIILAFITPMLLRILRDGFVSL